MVMLSPACSMPSRRGLPCVSCHCAAPVAAAPSAPTTPALRHRSAPSSRPATSSSRVAVQVPSGATTSAAWSGWPNQAPLRASCSRFGPCGPRTGAVAVCTVSARRSSQGRRAKTRSVSLSGTYSFCGISPSSSVSLLPLCRARTAPQREPHPTVSHLILLLSVRPLIARGAALHLSHPRPRRVRQARLGRVESSRSSSRA